MSKTPEEMAEEYRENHDECEFAREAFLAGYEAAKDLLLARFKSLLSSFAETSFNPNHTAWQIFDILNDRVADVSKVMPQWISVKDRLPEEGKLVLTYGPDGIIDVLARYRVSKNSWKWGRDGEFITLVFDITHWMPLPEPPKETK